jgi:hypothetical protein
MPATTTPGRPLCVLSRIDFRPPPSGLDSRDWRAPFELDSEDPTTGALLPGLFGLPWGEGDPKAARFDLDHVYDHGRRTDWCVVRIDDEKDVIAVGGGRDGDGGRPAAVRFYRGAIVYRGALRGALEALIQRGADPQRMSVRLALPDDTGVADAGDWGCAVADHHGIATSGAHGQSRAEFAGIAFAGWKGHAHACLGLAVVGAEGYAGAESCFGGPGVAIAAGHLATAVVSGDIGIAVATNYASRLEVGLLGTAVAMRDAGEIRTGRSSVVIVCCRKTDFSVSAPNGVAVTAEEGTLVIARCEEEDGSVRFAVNLVEKDDTADDRWSFVLKHGANFVLLDDDWKRVSPPPEAAGTPGLRASGDLQIALGPEARAPAGGIAYADVEFSMPAAGDHGVALALAEDATSAKAGARGLAFSRLSADAGAEGVAIGARSASAGARGIALCRGAGFVSGGAGCLLVTRNDREAPRWLYAVVGQEGIEPDREYQPRDGRLQPVPERGADDEALPED